jgi:hypothetical protein
VLNAFLEISRLESNEASVGLSYAIPQGGCCLVGASRDKVCCGLLFNRNCRKLRSCIALVFIFCTHTTCADFKNCSAERSYKAYVKSLASCASSLVNCLDQSTRRYINLHNSNLNSFFIAFEIQQLPCPLRLSYRSEHNVKKRLDAGATNILSLELNNSWNWPLPVVISSSC